MQPAAAAPGGGGAHPAIINPQASTKSNRAQASPLAAPDGGAASSSSSSSSFPAAEPPVVATTLSALHSLASRAYLLGPSSPVFGSVYVVDARLTGLVSFRIHPRKKLPTLFFPPAAALSDEAGGKQLFRISCRAAENDGLDDVVFGGGGVLIQVSDLYASSILETDADSVAALKRADKQAAVALLNRNQSRWESTKGLLLFRVMLEQRQQQQPPPPPPSSTTQPAERQQEQGDGRTSQDSGTTDGSGGSGGQLDGDESGPVLLLIGKQQ